MSIVNRLLRGMVAAITVTIIIYPVAAFANPLTLFTGIPPGRYFLEGIAGSAAEIRVLVPPGKNPHLFEPTPQQMVGLARADGYFAMGMPFEEQILPGIREINPGLTVIRLDEGIHKRQVAAQRDIRRLLESEEQDQAGNGGHRHGTLDPHIWTSPELALEIADNAFRGLVSLAPEGQEGFRDNYGNLREEIAAVDRRIEAMLSGLPHRSFIVFHPAWGYFAEAYDLTQIPVEIEGKTPKPRDIVRLIRFAEDQGIRTVFASPQFSQKSARAIAGEIAGSVISVDPLAVDWKTNLLETARKLADSMQR